MPDPTDDYHKATVKLLVLKGGKTLYLRFIAGALVEGWLTVPKELAQPVSGKDQAEVFFRLEEIMYIAGFLTGSLYAPEGMNDVDNGGDDG